MSFDVSWDTGMDYGVGVDEISLTTRGDAVNRTQPQAVTGAEGQTVTFYLDMLESLESLQTSMGMSMKAGGSYLGFGGSAKAKYVEQRQFNSYSVFLIVSVVVINAFRRMRDVSLKPAALELLKNGKMERFREQYGDLFVEGMYTGGEFYAIFEIETKDSSDYSSVSAQIKGGADLGVVSFNASAKFNQTVAKLSKTNNIKVTSFQRGGDSSPVMSVDDVIARAQALPKAVEGNKGVPFAVSLAEYRTLPIPDAPNWIDLQNAQDVIQDSLVKRNLLMKRLNDIDYILLHPQQFYQPDISALNGARKVLNDQVNTLTKAASLCIDKPNSCSFQNFEIPVAASKLPLRLPIKQDKKKNPILSVSARIETPAEAQARLVAAFLKQGTAKGLQEQARLWRSRLKP
jgi:hypothetical protein